MPRTRILLVESDDYSIAILQRFIESNCPDVEVDPVAPEESLPRLQHTDYDIIICDAYLSHEDKVNLAAQMCCEAQTLLIVITGHTDITRQTFSPHLDQYIHHILYKPFELEVLGDAVRCAVQRVKARKAPQPGLSA